MADSGFDLFAAAHQEMIHEGFDPDFPPEVERQLAAIEIQAATRTNADLRDLRSLLWSSIDNDTSRDLDQAEAAEAPEFAFLSRSPMLTTYQLTPRLKNMPLHRRPLSTPVFEPFRCCRSNYRRI